MTPFQLFQMCATEVDAFANGDCSDVAKMAKIESNLIARQHALGQAFATAEEVEWLLSRVEALLGAEAEVENLKARIEDLEEAAL
jgi:hypothetical protein